MKTKSEIRKEILNLRSALSDDEVSDISAEICRRAARLPVYVCARDVCFYMPVNNEVDVTPLMKVAFEDGKRVWLPRVHSKEMDFFRFKAGTRLVESAFGIPEPVSDERLEPESLALPETVGKGKELLIVMPGAVFSRERDRIGYGGGYYDRFLERHPGCVTTAVCYDFQILDELPAEAHDVKPDIVLSEKRMLCA